MSFHVKNTERYRIKPQKAVKLSQYNPQETNAFDGPKEKAMEELEALRVLLGDLQGLLYAQHKHKALIVLQAMDTAGKDSTIRMVFKGVNPQGVRVASFKVPTSEEADHDYLWRIHKQVPAKGEIVIFNRSHYEDILVNRVHKLVPLSEIEKRYTQINHFEHMLAQEGTVILKFFLHIDKEEQKKRLMERLQDPKKQWKFNISDLAERKLWPNYMLAYEDVMKNTSTTWAPWYVVPANKKWYRNLVIAHVITDALKKLKMKYLKPKGDLSKVKII